MKPTIKFKFTYCQLDVLFQLLKHEMQRDIYTVEMTDKLCLAVLHKTFNEIFRKQFLRNKENITVTLTLCEQLAFFIYFNPMQLADAHASVIVKNMCAEIHKQNLV